MSPNHPTAIDALLVPAIEPVLVVLRDVLAELRELVELQRTAGGVAATVSVSEAAVILGVTGETVRHWIARGRFPGVATTFGRQQLRATYRIPLAEVIAERRKQVEDAQTLLAARG